MKLLSKIFKGLSLAFCLSLMVTTFTPSVFAQDVECDCSDYEQTYLEARDAFEQELQTYAEIISGGNASAFIEYLSSDNLRTAHEAFVEAQENWEGCRERIAENADRCEEEGLKDEDRVHILNSPGRAAFIVDTVEQFRKALLEDLEIADHAAEALGRVSEDLTYEANVQAVIDYMVQEHNFSRIENSDQVRPVLRWVAERFLVSQGVYPGTDYLRVALERHAEEYDRTFPLAGLFLIQRFNLADAPVQAQEDAFAAVVQFFRGLGIGLPQILCPDCEPIRKAVADKKAEKAAAEQELTDAQNRKKAADDAVADFENDLADTIDNSDCEKVADYKAVNVGAGQAAGIIQGVHFFCPSEAAIEDMLEDLENFRNSNDTLRDLRQAQTDAQNDIAKARAKVARLTKELAKLEKRLENCEKLRKALAACAGVAQGPAGGGGDQADATPADGTASDSASGDRVPASVKDDIRSTFKYVVTSPERRKELRSGNKARLRLLHAAINKEFDSIQNRVDTSRFEDYKRLDEIGKRAVEYLTNRVPLFKGEDDGKRFGEDELLLRAVVAEILYRLASIGKIEGYDLDVSGVERPSDVPEGAWFEDAVKAAIKNGVFIPQDGKVRPGERVNWAEIVTILVRYYGLEAISPEDPSFDNVNREEWYTANFETLIEAGVLTRSEFTESLKAWDVPTKLKFARLLYNTLGDQATFVEDAE